ncbi:MAG TPA: Gfo/Idh/MocA family oxidoreductase [Gemmatimonadales bacterium]|nr:Gfo/Idh/MocA family oxidoreductase [Gemmatimonadales bacterium]
MRGAVLGLGGIARQSHLPAFRALAGEGAGLDVVAAVDPRFAGQRVEGLPVVATVDDLHSLGPIDFIDICTPTASHLELVLWGLARGYHVICEKPVALTAQEAARVVAAARAARRVVMPCHQHRYNPAWRQLRSWLEAGAIGAWHLAQFEVHRPAADPGAMGTPVPWRGQATDSRGGVLLDHGTHLLYQLLDVGGRPQAVQAWTGRLRHRDYDVEDTAEVIVDFGGRLAQLFLTWAGAVRENRIRFVGERGQAEWRGGTLRLVSGGETDELDFTAQLDKASYSGWFAHLFRDFAAAVRAQDGAAGLADLSSVAEVLALAYRSAAEGRRLSLAAAP